MEPFAKIVNNWKPLAIFVKNSILYVLLGSENTSIYNEKSIIVNLALHLQLYVLLTGAQISKDIHVQLRNCQYVVWHVINK